MQTQVEGIEAVNELRPLVYSMAELGVVFGISERHAYAMVAKGEIPGARRLGRRWIVPKSAVDRFLAGE